MPVFDNGGLLPRPGTPYIGAAGVQLVAAEMLKRGIIPSYQALDIGYDLISDYGGVLKRVQVKSQWNIERGREKNPNIRFSVMRRKVTADPGLASVNKDSKRHRRYDKREIDAMIFANFERDKYFIVPSQAVDLTRFYITFPEHSPWLNAWWVLGAPNSRLVTPDKAVTLGT
jgi:hypothetical protein